MINILGHKVKELSSGSSLYSFTPKELRQIKAGNFKEGDIIIETCCIKHLNHAGGGRCQSAKRPPGCHGANEYTRITS